MNHFEQMWTIYQEAFPEHERRGLAAQRSLLQNDRYQFTPLMVEQEVIGLLGTWNFEEFTFIEHYAIDRKGRGKGYGTHFLKQFLSQSQKTVVLEAEKPETLIAKKRIQFYENLNFHVNSFDYIQPPYDETKEPVPLLILSAPALLTEDYLKKIKRILYREVYGQSDLSRPI